MGTISTDSNGSTGLGYPTVPIDSNGDIKAKSLVNNQYSNISKDVSENQGFRSSPSSDDNGESSLVATEQLAEAVRNFFLSL